MSSQAIRPAPASIKVAKTGWAVGGHDDKPCEIEWTLARPVAWPTDKPINLILEQNHGSEHLLRGFQLSLAFSQTPTEQLAVQGRSKPINRFPNGSMPRVSKSVLGNFSNHGPCAANIAPLEPQSDGSYLAIGDISKRDEYQFQLELEPGTTGLMIEGLVDSSLPRRGPGRTSTKARSATSF